ncbi:PREDICTED: uncharacterized protein LOC108764954 isoform X3 [Trachymyrmex cornetzi]|uniref:Uncharacterized protein n=1 Tax=Trachymyrmex cornetzi TaxID=471704 RepID=A0A151J1H7_9HYME|nr:PREDICTED: uncharacterized protein LOC108764954 isoform X3 [Trachymyrmex cornetzi]XP_018368883.1 PREDICTED: uncharacterized protein LOC108764954 isoform X3 [Trachymyrmex cornetzi]XP_018368884.1 PREDICTED: uncharacterized protein LOC108764954 isoform X3 [Trachymyrmex cornetzi]XP_018368885.1 PREDICTED: uncharacterized protein LOC108764954 isoform X3 [Trachymyrmex cornetzi]XP_018368886.1 PREDICTED: uncharacterized protein LOC108764954 isoform X3 [Trachymyrmex cornetzi]XP_018368887.1 PREDICTED:
MTACYESPEVVIVLSKEEIHKRYQDTATIIFKEQQSRKKEIVSYLSFGNSRRTMEYSNNGNHPIIIRKPTESTIMQNTNFSSRTSIEYHKPDERCAIT